MITQVLSGLAGLLGLAVIFLWWQLGEAKEEIGSLEAAVEVAVSANGSNMDTISQLEAVIDTMILKRIADKEAADTAIANKEIEIKQARIDRARAEEERNEILESTEGCKSIADSRLDLLCPDIVDKLRIKAEGGGANQDNNPEG